MAEEFRFKNARGDCSAVDGNKAFAGPPAVVVNKAGEHLFSRSGFTGNQNGDVSFRYLQRKLTEAHHHIT